MAEPRLTKADGDGVEFPSSDVRSNSGDVPATIGGRFRVEAPLGKGGMATVYRVVDSVSGRVLALKQLHVHSDSRRRRRLEALFEYEFRTLSQLSHPRVIEVYDYGVDPSGPFYTMELLEAGDIKARSPLPYRDACALLFDVCSSLALLHSRKLLHRDVSVRNVRCTNDGHAKLIDFGALTPMGVNTEIVGTPAFIAPEALSRSALDARSDLYSVGATLYFALTGEPPYAARDFEQLAESWQARPLPPSHFAAGLPPALDALVLSLVSLDPALRPRTAFEVMERLAASAELDRGEPLAVLQAYLSAPRLIARDAELASIRTRLATSQDGRGSALVFEGEAGVGRSRVLEACVLDAKTQGLAVVAASAAATGVGSFALAQTLVEKLVTTVPEFAQSSTANDPELSALFGGAGGAKQTPTPLTDLKLARPALQAALARWFLLITERQPLVIAVDDVDRADEASIALVATLARAASGQRLLLLLTAAPASGEMPSALALLLEACERRTLAPLSLAEVEQWLGSIFGDVPNLQLLSARIYASAGGNPRDGIDRLRHLLDHGVIRYEHGNWTLPAALDTLELPASAEELLHERFAALPPLARTLLETQALASHGAFTRDEYNALADTAATLPSVDHSLAELVARQLLLRDGVFYTLERSRVAQAASAALTDDARSARHRALARLYENKGLALIAVKHLLLGGMLEEAFARLAEVMRSHTGVESLSATMRLSVPELASVFAHARALAGSRVLPERDLAEIEHWLVMLATGADEHYYFENAVSWLLRLERDSGLAAFRKLEDVKEPGQRLQRALTEANQRFQAAPEAERCYSPIEAIQFLAHYVAASLAVGARVNDAALLGSLPELLEPFAPLAPLLDAIWQNALAAREFAVFGRTARARALWLAVHAKLEQVTGPDLRVIQYIRNAVAYAIALSEAAIGLESASSWADRLDNDPLQAVNAMYLRRALRLIHGDVEGAERFRRQAELLDVQASARPMFTSTLVVDLVAFALAHELTGVQQAMERIGALAERFPGWLPHRDLAEGYFQRLRGDLVGARAALERCIARVQPDFYAARAVSCWPYAIAAYLEVLTELGEAERACDVGEAALAICAQRGTDLAVHAIARGLALAETQLGKLRAAEERMERVIAEQRALGTSGLHLGASYEVRARIAIAQKDEATIESYARLTAIEYRRGTSRLILGRYERLLDAAQSVGVNTVSAMSGLHSTAHLTRALGSRVAASGLVTREMRGADTAEQRAARALRLLCEADGAHAGQLYLFNAENKLQPVATLGAPEIGADFETWATGYLAHDQRVDEEETAIEAGGEPSALETRPKWPGSQEVIVQSLPLRCVVQGVSRCIGIAALITTERVPRASTHLVAAVSAYLVRAGDA